MGKPTEKLANQVPDRYKSGRRGRSGVPVAENIVSFCTHLGLVLWCPPGSSWVLVIVFDKSVGGGERGWYGSRGETDVFRAPKEKGLSGGIVNMMRPLLCNASLRTTQDKRRGVEGGM